MIEMRSDGTLNITVPPPGCSLATSAALRAQAYHVIGSMDMDLQPRMKAAVDGALNALALETQQQYVTEMVTLIKEQVRRAGAREN